MNEHHHLSFLLFISWYYLMMIIHHKKRRNETYIKLHNYMEIHVTNETKRKDGDHGGNECKIIILNLPQEFEYQQ